MHWVNFTVYNTDLNKSGLEISNKGRVRGAAAGETRGKGRRTLESGLNLLLSEPLFLQLQREDSRFPLCERVSAWPTVRAL